ncbi:MAG: GNAT family N-acetyltransferase [Clostridia bacterium]|nr:GNAT family N-acetyltransferase [Clostridia bacterium]MBT7122220.1 GNAT family N-acetyltransferase [Clostridia bacterium]
MNIETQSLLIRQFEKDDWKHLHAYTSKESVMKFIPDGAYTREDAQKFIEENLGEEAEKFAVILKAENVLVGHMYFHKWFAPKTYEIGWVFNEAYQGKGYATQAAQALVDYGFDVLRLHRIIATCQPQNPPSWRVAQKIGMTKEGHFRKCILSGEDWWDEMFYAVLDEDRDDGET